MGRKRLHPEDTPEQRKQRRLNYIREWQSANPERTRKTKSKAKKKWRKNLSKEAREAVSNKNRAYLKEWYPKNKEKALAASKAWRAKPHDQIKSRPGSLNSRARAFGINYATFNCWIKRYGLPLEEIERFLEARKDRQHCDICGNTEKLRLDHCHARRVIRGLLCHSCNVALGSFKDSPELLIKAARYLMKESENAEFIQ